MSLSIASVFRTIPGADTSQESTLTGDTSYVNGTGYVLTPDMFNLRVIRKIISVRPVTIAAATWLPIIIETFNQDGSIATAALRLVVAATGAEVANAANVSTAVFRIIVEGD